MRHISLKKNIMWRVIGNEAVLLESDRGNFFRFNSTGAAFLKSIAEGADIDEAADRLTKQFAVTKEVARKDIDVFIAALEKEGMLEGPE